MGWILLSLGKESSILTDRSTDDELDVSVAGAGLKQGPDKSLYKAGFKETDISFPTSVEYISSFLQFEHDG